MYVAVVISFITKKQLLAYGQLDDKMIHLFLIGQAHSPLPSVFAGGYMYHKSLSHL